MFWHYRKPEVSIKSPERTKLEAFYFLILNCYKAIGSETA